MRSNVTCGQIIIILVDGQKSHGQMSLRSNVPRSNVTGGQMSRGQMSPWSNVPRSNVTAVKCPAVKCHLRSNVPRSNVTCGQMSRGQMSLWSNVTKSWSGQKSVVKCPMVKWDCGHRRPNPLRRHSLWTAPNFTIAQQTYARQQLGLAWLEMKSLDDQLNQVSKSYLL